MGTVDKELNTRLAAIFMDGKVHTYREVQAMLAEQGYKHRSLKAIQRGVRQLMGKDFLMRSTKAR